MTRNWGVVTGLALALGAGSAAGCKNRDVSMQSDQNGAAMPAQQAEQAQKSAEQALDEARKAQQRATEQQQQAVKASDEVSQQQRKLDEARARADRERAEAQQAQAQAQTQAAQAQDRAQQLQQQALTAQQQAEQRALLDQRAHAEQQRASADQAAQQQAAQQPPAAQQPSAAQQPPMAQQPPVAAQQPADTTGLAAFGRVGSFGAGELILNRTDGSELRVRVDPSTPVAANAAPSRNVQSVNDLTPGDPVRVQYRMVGGEAVADHIDLAAPARPTVQGRSGR